MAKSGQRYSHSLQLMQASPFTTVDLPFSRPSTCLGQKATQIPQPLHHFSLISILGMHLSPLLEKYGHVQMTEKHYGRCKNAGKMSYCLQAHLKGIAKAAPAFSKKRIA
jgi:hypothetical protein